MSSTNKRRRSSSPSTPPSLSRVIVDPSLSQSRSRPSASPANPTLPPPIPSFPAYAPPGGPGPSTWQTWRGPGDRDRERAERDLSVRRSMDAKSPVSDMTSPRMGMENIEEGGEMMFTRDTSSRAPRSMMACTRCRRQKMKCDGPSQVPCRGCRQSGQPCIFEARNRPKSISAIPSRAPPFYPGGVSVGRPMTPTGPPGPPGFYPVGAQPAPPITTRTPAGDPYAGPPPADYALRAAREPMPPPPPTSLSVLAAPYPPRSPPVLGAPSTYYPTPSPAAPPPAPTPFSTSTRRSTSPTPEVRLKSVEALLRPLQGLPTQLDTLQAAITSLARTQEASVPPTFRPPLRAREIVSEVPENVWESYRSRAWPLTPWLVGLREGTGLPGLVVSYLGKRTLVDKSEEKRRDCEKASREVVAEVGRLVTDRVEWTREEIRALGVFSTWSNDPTLACLAVGSARALLLDRLVTRRAHDDWREWIYISIMDKLCQVVDFSGPTTNDSLAAAWRERLSASAPGDSAVRDRDLKLLAWLEYAETLVDIHSQQQTARAMVPPHSPVTDVDEEAVSVKSASSPRDARRAAEVREKKEDRSSFSSKGSQRAERTGTAGPPGSGGAGSATGSEDAERKKAMEPWKKFATKWEAWAGGWAVRSDPILSLHFNYAILFTASPVFLASVNVWTELSQNHDGYSQLERGRDAAFAVIQAICSPEISRTLPYSFGLYRPIVGLALAHILSLANALPSSPLISASLVLSVLRSMHDALVSALPLDMAHPISGIPTISHPGSRPTSSSSTSLLAEIALHGISAGREVLGAEPGRELWRRLVG